MSQLRGSSPATEVAALVAGLGVVVPSPIGVVRLTQLAAPHMILDGFRGSTARQPCTHISTFPVGVRAALGLARGRVGSCCAVVALPGLRIF